MNNRIGLLLKVKDVTASKFAEMIGVQPSNISHILSGRNKPSLDFVMKVCETFPDIQIEWLMFGKGNMFKGESITQANYSERHEIIDENKSNETIATSGIPDLFSQHYPSENSIIDSESTDDQENFNENDEKESMDSNIQEQDAGKEFSSTEKQEEVFAAEEKEEITQAKVKEESEKTGEEQKSVERIHSISAFKQKPVKMVFIYEDDTFEIMQLRVE